MHLTLKEVKIGIIVLLNLLIITTIIEPLETAVFILYLNTFAVLLIRVIYQKYQTMLVDFIVLALITSFYPLAIVLFIPHLFISLANKKLIPLIIFVILQLVFFESTTVLLLTLISAAFAITVYLWEKDETESTKEEDRLRKTLYNLQAEQTNLLNEQTYTHHHIALEERMRIAEKLHDDLGHALTAAKLALDAYELSKEGNPGQAKKSFNVVKEKIKDSTDKLKQTVAQVTPNELFGKDAFIKRIETAELNIKTTITQNTKPLSVMHWQLLDSVLKEALTNIYKHATPTQVTLDLTITQAIVKLTISNDGVRNPNQDNQGFGLRYMRKRLEAVKGTLTIQKGLTFTLIAVMPLRSET